MQPGEPPASSGRGPHHLPRATASESMKPTIVYITSRGHSGSTLLDLLVSGHSAVTSVGEVKLLDSDRQEACACGASTVWVCPFWKRVDEWLREHRSLALADLRVGSDAPHIFHAHNDALFAAVANLTGKTFVVDSSKNVDRLTNLLAAGSFDVRVIHLIRRPHGVVHSNVKLKRDWLQHARNWAFAEFRSHELLSDRDHLTVRYEQLARAPRRELERVMVWLGLHVQEDQLEWAHRERHNIGGNPMRFSNSSEIRLDRSWRRGLSIRQKIAISWITLPARLGAWDLYVRYRPLWEGNEVRDFLRKELQERKAAARRFARRLLTSLRRLAWFRSW